MMGLMMEDVMVLGMQVKGYTLTPVVALMHILENSGILRQASVPTSKE